MNNYKPCTCGADCVYFGMNDNEPCWGETGPVEEVEIGDGEYGWIHACEGHKEIHDGGEYKTQPEEE